jgi:hypothetical protein
VSNLSTYVAGALAAVLVMDHAPAIGIFPFDLLMPPGEIADSAITVNRAFKGDRQEPVRVQRDSRPVNAPLEVVDLPTGSIGGKRSLPAPASPLNNVTAVMKREAPARDQPPGKQALPLGCESAFGRLAAPPLARVPGRCII